MQLVTGKVERRGKTIIVTDPDGRRRVFHKIKPGSPAAKHAERQLRRQQSGPGLIRKASNYAKATAKHIAAGRPKATDDQVAARFRVCQQCPLFLAVGDGSKKGRCTHVECGCSLNTVGLKGKNKLRWADQVCPDGRWSRCDA